MSMRLPKTCHRPTPYLLSQTSDRLEGWYLWEIQTTLCSKTLKLQNKKSLTSGMPCVTAGFGGACVDLGTRAWKGCKFSCPFRAFPCSNSFHNPPEGVRERTWEKETLLGNAFQIQRLHLIHKPAFKHGKA